MLAKSTIDVAKSIRTNNTRTIIISGIVPRNDNFNNKALDVNVKLSKMCREAEFRFHNAQKHYSESRFKQKHTKSKQKWPR